MHADRITDGLNLAQARLGLLHGSAGLHQRCLRFVVPQSYQHLAGLHAVAFTHRNALDAGRVLARHFGARQIDDAPAGYNGLQHLALGHQSQFDGGAAAAEEERGNGAKPQSGGPKRMRASKFHAAIVPQARASEVQPPPLVGQAAR